MAERPARACVANRAVVDGVTSVLAGGTALDGPRADLSLHFCRAAQAKRGFFRAEKVTDHLGQAGVKAGRVPVMAEFYV